MQKTVRISPHGGYSVQIAGRPVGEIVALPEPTVLYLPLRSQRFCFGKICVDDGARVKPGQILAVDEENHQLPLLAPRAGTVRLEALDGHIVLEEVVREEPEEFDPEQSMVHIPQEANESAEKCRNLVELGAWRYVWDAHTRELPDPFKKPQAVIVSTLQLEPFLARGEAQLATELPRFMRGLEHLQSLLEYQPIYLVLPEVDSALAQKVHETIRGYAWVAVVPVELRYPADDFRVLAEQLKLKRQPDSSVWAVQTDGIIAFDRALTEKKPCTSSIISLAGPMVTEPTHIKVTPGYPVEQITAGRVQDGPVRVINGGVLRGTTLDEGTKGVPLECAGLTVLEEQTEREMLSFARPGSDRQSYSKCFLSRLRKGFEERLTTALRGEKRACIACGFCEEVCPVGIMPHRIHRLLYQDDLERADQARADRCIGCGLCSFVCPSKIDLAGEIVAAQETIRQELQAEEVSA